MFWQSKGGYREPAMVIETTVFVSALAGLGSFLSPCILPILPGFISYLSGSAANEAKNSQKSEMGTTGYGNGAGAAAGGEIGSSSSSTTIQPVALKTSARLNIFLN